MLLKFIIDEHDYLTHLLFTASQSASIKKKRRKSRIIIPAIYLLLAVVMAFDSIIFSIFLLAFALFWYLYYPSWVRRRYIKLYTKHISENYDGRQGRLIELEFNEDYLMAKDEGSESKIWNHEIDAINDIPTLFLIKFKTGNSMLLPKNKLENIDSVKAYLTELSKKTKVAYNTFPNWVWK